MAKVNVEFDTEGKTLKMTIDGKEMTDCVGINFRQDYYYAEEGKQTYWMMGVDCENMDDPNLRMYTRICANDAQKSIAKLIENGMKGR